MKSIVFFGLVSILLLPLIAIGCDSSGTTAANGDKTIEISLDEFAAQNNIVRNITIDTGASLIVRLGSNPSTGYQWGEALISAPDVINRSSREFTAPENTEIVGAPGTDVLTFDSLKAGSAAIELNYGRPWESGGQGEFTLTINVTVK